MAGMRGYAVTKYWIGVASRDHVRMGMAGGFCQLCHGKAAPMRRLKSGDRIIYYSPRERTRDGAAVQAFTGIGEVAAGEPEPHDMGGGFVPYRRSFTFYKASDAPIQPLLPLLSFTRGRAQWGIVLRRGVFAIDRKDYESSPTRWVRRGVRNQGPRL
jgi:EVE domain